MDSRPRLHGGRLSAGKTDGGRGSVRGTRFRGNDRWGVEGRGRAVLEPPLPEGREVRMDSRPRLHGGRLSAGKTDGGEGIREGGGWDPLGVPESTRFQVGIKSNSMLTSGNVGGVANRV